MFNYTSEHFSKVLQQLDEKNGTSSTFFDSADENFDQLARRLGKGVTVSAALQGDECYPRKLALLSPKERPFGFVALGELSLLERSMVGICGSRKASARGLGVTAEVCAQLARDGVVVVSGYAAGVDETAHRTCLEQGGATICVLAEGMNHFRVRRTLKEAWDWSRVLVISQFGLRAVWQAGRAMLRNKTIVGLSDATIVVEARDKGGTLDAGFTALRLKKPLFVAEYSGGGDETAGNALLLAEGATPLRRSRSSGGPSFAAIRRVLDTQATFSNESEGRS